MHLEMTRMDLQSVRRNLLGRICVITGALLGLFFLDKVALAPPVTVSTAIFSKLY